MLKPIWGFEEIFPEGMESVRYAIHPDLGREPVFTLKPLWEDVEPYVVPDDAMDIAFGLGAVALVIGGIAYFAGPVWAAAFVLEPGTMTVTFFGGVVLSNWIQEQYRDMS